MEKKNVIEKIKERKALLFLFIFIVSILAIAWIMSVVFDGGKSSVLLLALFLLSFLGFLISSFYILQVLFKIIARNKKIVLFFIFVLLVGFMGFWFIYPRFTYKEEFDKYCEEIAKSSYICDFSDIDENKRSEISNHIERYCVSLWLDYYPEYCSEWGCSKNRPRCLSL